jgi:NTE family protein
VGLALGAGGARGLAHIGVLQVLTEAGIPIDSVVGTSSGALVGAVYAAGQLENFERQVREYVWTDVLAMWDPVWPRSGIMSGSKALERLAGLLGEWKMEDLAVPFGAVTVDLVTGDEILMRRGRVVDAVRASISVPGVFVPLRQGRRLLVDGAIRNPVPVSALGEMGADFRIAVNLHHEPVREIVSGPSVRLSRSTIAARVADAIDTRMARFRRKAKTRPSADEPNGDGEDGGNDGDGKAGVPNIFEILMASMSVIEYELAQHRLARDPVDVLIEPDVRRIRAFEFHKAHQAIAAGRKAAEAQIDEIRRQLTRRLRVRRR